MSPPSPQQQKLTQQVVSTTTTSYHEIVVSSSPSALASSEDDNTTEDVKSTTTTTAEATATGLKPTSTIPKQQKVPKLGPNPTMLSRKEIDTLYDTFEAIIHALNTLNVDYIVTGGTLLGAIRQHSILFCDDDIDIAIIERGGDGCDGGSSSASAYSKVQENLQSLLGKAYQYQIKPWEGGDKIRPRHVNTVFVDLFVIRKYESLHELLQVIGVKKNGQSQSVEYINNILTTIRTCINKDYHGSTTTTSTPTIPFPIYHFATRKAIEMWMKEVYLPDELFPISTNLKFGPLTNIKGPNRILKTLASKPLHGEINAPR